MKITIIYRGAFPHGSVGANRILSYSKQIVKLGHKVVVHCVQPTKNYPGTEINPLPTGIYQGVEYVFTSNRTTWPRDNVSIVYKVLHSIIGYLNSLRLLKQYKKAGEADILYLYSNALFDIYIFFIVSRLLKIPYVQEKSEYPFVLRNTSWLGRIYAYFYVSTVYKLFDGMIIETSKLIDYFKTKTRKSTKICRIPMTVDLDRFNLDESKRTKDNYIAYCGNMEKLDGISILIEAFAEIAFKYPTLKLFLIGKCRDDTYNEYISRVNELNLNDQVVFTGKVSSQVVPELLCNAKLLVLASPLSQRSQGSMPSKLGEYLATGNPTLVTSVGEIPEYLTDGENAFLAEPDSIDAFAAKLDFILGNYDETHKVGQKGKELAYKFFNAKYQAKKMITFFRELQNNTNDK